MSENNPRIFVGFNGAGTVGIYNYVHVLKNRGYKIDFYGFEKGRLNKPVDVLLKFSHNPVKSFFERVSYFFKILPEYDVWHFNFAETLFFYPLCLLILKIYGKKIVVTFHGSDVETDLDFLKTHPLIKNKKPVWPSYYKNFYQRSWWGKFLRRIRMKIMVKMADSVAISGPYLAHSVTHFDKIIGNAQNIDHISSFEAKKDGKITVLHAPSDPKIKGTSYIKSAFNNLSEIYPNVDFKVLEVLDRDQLLQEMANADIIVDQLLVGWYGVQALDGLTLGKTVMCFINPPYANLMNFDQEIPIINTNVFSFEQDLKDLIDSKDINRFQTAGPTFIKKYFDQEIIADEYEAIYRRKK
jgi:hypothetical protein